MTQLPDTVDLSGRSILIVEDAYYLAMEIRDTVVRAGATVVGPFADAAHGLTALREAAPDAAVIDINLGAGPSFEIADALRGAAVPFVFLTGYDAGVIPRRFADIAALQKPANMARLLDRVGAAMNG